MKKLIGVLAIASVFSFVLMGCTPPTEGDTAPAPKTDAPKTDASKTEAPKTESETKPTTTTG